MAQEQSEHLLEIDEELLDDLEGLIELRDDGALKSMLIDLHAADIARLLTYLHEDERHYILDLIEEDVAGEVVLHLPEDQRTDYLAELEPHEITDLVEELSPDDAADIVAELDDDVAEEVLRNLQETDVEATEEIRGLLLFGEDTAGGRMTTDFVAVTVDDTVAASIERVREFVRETELEVHGLFVLDRDERLVGLLRLQDLVLRPPTSKVSIVMSTDIVTVAPDEDQAVVAQVMLRYDLIDVPVVDDDGHLIGIITFDDIADIIEDEASEDMLYLAGVTEAESPTTGPFAAVRRRLPWLAVNLGVTFIPTMIMSRFEGTIGDFPKIAILLPIVAGMGGNAAIQSITVMVRSIALGEISPGQRRRVILKETATGLLNGVAMGVTGGLMVWLLWGNPALGAVLTVALIANLFIAGLAGAVIPLVLRRLNFDPALSSGPLVTSLTDISGYSVFLALSTTAMALLLHYR
jgi:magnesium transporter